MSGCTYLYNIAVPSWVLCGTLAENIAFLQNKVKEVELLCFEPSLPDLSEIPQEQKQSLGWHIHLPSFVPHDFFEKTAPYTNFSVSFDEHTKWLNPWYLSDNPQDFTAYAIVCQAIFQHCQELRPWLAVLHLPPTDCPFAKEKLIVFLESWAKHLPLSLLAFENIDNACFSDYQDILLQPAFHDVKLCLDVAHALAFEQKNIITNKNLMEKVVLAHWSSPYSASELQQRQREEHPESDALQGSDSSSFKQVGNKKNPKDKHLALYHLEIEKDFCSNVMQALAKNTIHVIEVFQWEEIEKSIPFFQTLSMKE